MLGHASDPLASDSSPPLHDFQLDPENPQCPAHAPLVRGENYEVAQHWIGPDGSSRLLRYVGRAINPADLSLGTLWVVEDITDCSRADEILCESEAKYRILFNNERTAICIFDLETRRFLVVNDAHIQLYGYSRDEFLHERTIFDLAAEPEETNSTTQQAQAGGTIFIPLLWHRKKDGTIFPVEIVGGPDEWMGRRVMFAMAFDISERREAKERLRERARRATSPRGTGHRFWGLRP